MKNNKIENIKTVLLLLLVVFAVLNIYKVNTLEYMKTTLQEQLNTKETENIKLEKQLEKKTDQINTLNKKVDKLEKEMEWLLNNTIFVNSGGSFKSFMDYRSVIDTTSKQYQLIYSGDIYVGSDGLLYSEDGYIGVALGSAFGDIGDKFIIKTDTGNKIKAIKLDSKADKDTVDGIYHKTDGSVVEFLVDTDKIEYSYPISYEMGSFNFESKFSGYVTSVTKVGGW